jgi:hypothetical protein
MLGRRLSALCPVVATVTLFLVYSTTFGRFEPVSDEFASLLTGGTETCSYSYSINNKQQLCGGCRAIFFYCDTQPLTYTGYGNTYKPLPKSEKSCGTYTCCNKYTQMTTPCSP